MLTSLVRTLVPVLVGFLITTLGLGRVGLSEADLTPAVTALVTAVYYIAARALEQYVTPRFGWLLGAPTAPTYAGTGDTGPA